jgi:23S rRNA (cytosine1962-C5)-methyltransferase
VFDHLAALAKRGARFDLICCDPPTYSTTKSSRWTSGRAWVELARACLAVLAPGGRLLACSNDHRMKQSAFRRYLHEAARASKVRVDQVKDLPCPPDFPPPFGQEPHLKSVLLTRAR